MSRDYESSDSVDYPAAVAAAAFAVKSIEDKGEKDHRRTNSGGADKPFTKIKSKADDTIPKKPDKFSDEVSKPRPKLPDKSVPIRTATINPDPLNTVPSIKKNPTFGDTKPESEVTEKAKRVPSMKKTSTFPDQSIDINAPKAPEVPISDAAVRSMRQSSSQIGMGKGTNIMKPGSGNSKADIWEKEEMEKIRERYTKLITEIVEWQTKKKKKAKRNLERIEAEILSNKNNMKLQAELDRRRTKAMRHFNNEVGRIESIAEGAKEQANQNRENEELKVKEKANKIRSTGKMPATCSCF